MHLQQSRSGREGKTERDRAAHQRWLRSSYMAHTRLADRRGPRAGMLEQRGVLVRVGAYSMDIWPLDRHGTSTRSHGGAGATAEMARLKKAVRGRGPRRAVTAWERRRCSINDSGFADDDGSGQRKSRGGRQARLRSAPRRGIAESAPTAAWDFGCGIWVVQVCGVQGNLAACARGAARWIRGK
jgi:hypothetical protein